MLHRFWGYVFRRAVMCDADRLMKAHGDGAYGMALVGVRAAREGGDGHWSAVAGEILRRTGRVCAHREVRVPVRRSWVRGRPGATVTRSHRP